MRNCGCSGRVLNLAKWFYCHVFSSTESGSIWRCLCWPHGHYRGRFECSCPVDWQVCESLSIVSSNEHQERRTPVLLTNNHLIEETHRKGCWQREHVSSKRETSLVIIIARNCNLYYIPPCRTNIRNFSIRFQGPKFFNSLSPEIQNSESIRLFGERLKKFLLS